MSDFCDEMIRISGKSRKTKKPKMKQVLISGASGFIGSHLLEELIKNKNLWITCIDDFSTGKEDNLPFGRYELVRKRIQDWKTDKKFDIIYHLAAKANTRANGTKEFEDNVMATEAVVKLLKPNGRIVFSSSCSVYGNQKVVTEKSPYQPISLYGFSKWHNELTIMNNCKKWTIFRFSNVFGERQDGSNEMGLIGICEHALRTHKRINVFNKGVNERDYIYVKDVVRALINVKKKDIFQIGQNKIYKTLDLVNLSGVSWAYGKNNNEVDSIQLDNTKLKKTGWRPTLTVDEYIKKIKNENSL